MSLVIETGAGLSNAQSYVDTTFVNAYFVLRGVTFTSTDANIINAMDYFEATYSQSWKGEKLVSTQALSFPRLIDGVNTYPVQVKNAICELAYKASTATLLPDGSQAVKREKVDVIEVEYQDFTSSTVNYSLVNAMVSPWLNASGSAHNVLRT